MRCVACRRAVLLVTRAMTLTCRSAGWVMSCRVCLRARVCGVMVSGSAALVGICVRCALGLRKCEEWWLRHTRDVQCASWACVAGAVSSAVTRGLVPQYRDCGFVLLRVRCCTASRCGCCVTAQRCVRLFACLCRCVVLRCVHACVTVRRSGRAVLGCARVVGDGGCRWQSMSRTSAARVL